MADHDKTRTPGQILRAAREKGEFSLFDAEEGTKIPRHLLESIERDEYHKLSGPIYVRSFLRNYAGWLGLDAGQILSVYETATGRPEPMTGANDQVWSEDQVAVTRVGMPWLRLVVIAVVAAVALLVLVVLALRFFGGRGDDAAVAGPPPPARSAVSTLPERQTVVTRSEPADEPAAEQTSVTDGAGDPVRPEVQPTFRTETPADRLARLTGDRFGGVAEEAAATSTAIATAGEPAPAVAAPTPQTKLAPPRRGDAELRFAGGETFPLVLRVLMPEPANCAVRRDDQADALPVIWPDNPGPLPAYNLRHGLAYAVAGGYAIYWGAEDHFTLTLGRINEVEVSLNGHAQSLANWRPGQTKLLDASRLTPDGG